MALCPRPAERLGGARKPHAVVLLPFETCTRACVATLCTCSSEFTPDLAQAHASLSCPPARALEPPALATRCTCACLVTLSTCSSEITSYLAQAHVRASCSAARSLEPPALAQLSAQTLIGEPSPVVAAHTWPLCPRAAGYLGGARKPYAVFLMPFQSCTCACVATLSTCSSEVTCNLAQAHVRASCSAARSLELPALAKVLAQPLIG